MQPSNEMESSRQQLSGGQFATFFVDGTLFGLEVLKVQEVLRYQEMTCVPLAPSIIQGLINLRGQIVTALDMRRRLGLAPRPAESLPMNVVVRCEDGPLSLLVDEIGDVIEVHESQFAPPPVNMPKAQRDVVDGVIKLEDRLLMVLNMERTLRVA